MSFTDQTTGLFDKAQAWRSTLRFYCYTASALIASGILLHAYDRQLAHTAWADREQAQVEITSGDLHRQFSDSLSELLILASQDELLANTPEANKNLTKSFIRIAHVLPYFQQLRLIDLAGKEVVRVDTNDGNTVSVPVNKLQNKSQRYYFVQGKALQANEVYVSPMDLNMEHGQIEQPWRPMIRFVLPAIDSHGNRQGLLVANFAAENLLGNVAKHDKESPARLMLLNSEGYWLYSDQREDSWGFQLPHKRRFSTVNADTWKKILDSSGGQLRNTQGLYTYRTVSNVLLPRLDRDGSSIAVAPTWKIVNAPHWYLVSEANNQLILTEVVKRGQVGLVMGLIVLLLLIPVSRTWGIRHARYAYADDRIRAYAALIEQSNDLIYLVSEEGKILFVNPAVEQCYGYNQQDMVGKSPSIFKSGRHPDEFYKLLRQTTSAGDVFEGIFFNKHKNGSRIYEAKRIIPIHLGESGKTVFVSIGKDLTANSDKFHHDMRSADYLSRGIQHHFGNLLHGLQGLIQLAMNEIRSGRSDTAGEMLKVSLESALRTQDLVSRIVLASRREMGYSLPVDLVAVVEKVVAKLQPQMPNRIELSLTVAENLPQSHGNVELLELALEALIENARDAIPKTGQIRVTLGVMKPAKETCINCDEPILVDHLAITVTDNGMGISKKDQKIIFDPFYSTKDSANLVANILGLGLTTVRSIAHSHGGHILLESKEGAGTTVRLLLPLQNIV